MSKKCIRSVARLLLDATLVLGSGNDTDYRSECKRSVDVKVMREGELKVFSLNLAKNKCMSELTFSQLILE